MMWKLVLSALLLFGCGGQIPGGSGGSGGGGGGGAGGEQPIPTEGDVAGLAAAVNKVRAGRGLSQIPILPALNCAAQRHANDIGPKGICGHTGSDGTSPWQRAGDCGTSANGEIVACGQGSADQATQAWTFSPGHAMIMYDPSQKFMGVGMVNNYWVVIFQK